MLPTEKHDRPHPFVARVAVAAIAAAILFILWARVEVLGTRDIERTLGVEQAANGKHLADDVAASAYSRWATGFSE